jgi:hypothetical protein
MPWFTNRYHPEEVNVMYPDARIRLQLGEQRMDALIRDAQRDRLLRAAGRGEQEARQSGRRRLRQALARTANAAEARARWAAHAALPSPRGRKGRATVAVVSAGDRSGGTGSNTNLERDVHLVLPGIAIGTRYRGHPRRASYTLDHRKMKRW